MVLPAVAMPSLQHRIFHKHGPIVYGTTARLVRQTRMPHAGAHLAKFVIDSGTDSNVVGKWAPVDI